ncbi:MAG: hypothetical protein U1F43_37195 [Myxococcota bacterium]
MSASKAAFTRSTAVALCFSVVAVERDVEDLVQGQALDCRALEALVAVRVPESEELEEDELLQVSSMMSFLSTVFLAPSRRPARGTHRSRP